jgi:hypothetical protein
MNGQLNVSACECGCGQSLTRRGQRFVKGHNAGSHQRGSPEIRFWSHVERTEGCWNYRGANRYGVLMINRSRTQAHRFSYELHNGPIPAGMEVLHSCDNPACVCPDHLSLGAHQQNMAEARSRGRIARGERNPKATITESQARKIISPGDCGEWKKAVGVLWPLGCMKCGKVW